MIQNSFEDSFSLSVLLSVSRLLCLTVSPSLYHCLSLSHCSSSSSSCSTTIYKRQGMALIHAKKRYVALPSQCRKWLPFASASLQVLGRLHRCQRLAIASASSKMPACLYRCQWLEDESPVVAAFVVGSMLLLWGVGFAVALFLLLWRHAFPASAAPKHVRSHSDVCIIAGVSVRARSV